MRTALLAVMASATFVASAASAQEMGGLEIRFCPSSQVRTFPLESRRGVQSLLLQNAVIINHRASSTEITDITLELLRDASPVDTRRIVGADLALAAASGPRIQKSGMLRLLAFQFCGSALIADGVLLAGPTLEPGQALLLSQQPFAFRGTRDTLRLRVHARFDSHDSEVVATLPIQSGFGKTGFRFPLRGVWLAAVGPTLHTAHRWALPEEFAYDIARLGQGDLSHKDAGLRFADYYAYGAPVLAAAAGVVTAAVNDEPENAAVLRRPDETDEAYGARLQEMQAGLLSKGTRAVAGNHVVIDHGGGEYSLYAHLQPGTVRVRVGDRIAAGARLGRLGSSGNSTEPHLHFQVCDTPDPLVCAGIPVQFQGVTLPFADYPRPLQSGDVVIAR
jgi:murein DD-endopeptidase MepM/ murein hydrolase activator NlpD